MASHQTALEMFGVLRTRTLCWISCGMALLLPFSAGGFVSCSPRAGVAHASPCLLAHDGHRPSYPTATGPAIHSHRHRNPTATGPAMVLVRAVVLYDFDSTEYGAEYLAVSAGAHVVVNTATEDQGWVVAAVSNGGYPLCGWIPSEIWSSMAVLNVSNGANVAVNIAAEDKRPMVVAVRDGGQPLCGLTEIFQSKFSVIPYLTFCDWKMLLDLAMVNKNAWRYSMEHYREHTEAVCDEKFPTVCQRFPSFKSDVLRYGLPDLRHALVRSNGEHWLYPVWRRVRIAKTPPSSS